jgi:hypothetical protein
MRRTRQRHLGAPVCEPSSGTRTFWLGVASSMLASLLTVGLLKLVRRRP